MATNLQPTTIDDALSAFLLDVEARRLSPRTYEFYQFQLDRQFNTWCAAQGLSLLAAVTARHLRDYLAGLRARGLAASTQHAAARALRTFFRWCEREGMLAASPMANVKMPKLDKMLPVSFTRVQMARLVNSAPSTRDKAIVLTLLDTGLRAAEMVALVWGDVNLSSGAVLVRQGKGAKQRTVYLGAKTRRALARYHSERRRPPASSFVWASLHGGGLTTEGLRQMLERLGRRADVAGCTPHTFRRTFALESLRAGMTIYALQRLMGHEDLSTLRRYLQLAEIDLEEAHRRAGVVDNLL